MESDPQQIEQAALRLLAAREHSREELARKLRRKGWDGGVLQQVLDDLVARRLLSDERFVEQYIDMRRRKGYGPVRIRAELQERGIDPQLIEDWLDSRDPQWRQELREVVRRKYGDAGPADYREQAKRARFLEYRGFPADLIRRTLFDD